MNRTCISYNFNNISKTNRIKINHLIKCSSRHFIRYCLSGIKSVEKYAFIFKFTENTRSSTNKNWQNGRLILVAVWSRLPWGNISIGLTSPHVLSYNTCYTNSSRQRSDVSCRGVIVTERRWSTTLKSVYMRTTVNERSYTSLLIYMVN